MLLRIEQVESFKKDGFLILHSFLEAEVAQAIKNVALIHLNDKIEPIESEIDYGEKSEEYRINITNYSSIEAKEKSTVRRLRQVYDRNILFKNWMENKKIRPILKQLLNDKVVITTAHHNSIMTKLPMLSTSTSWHQDRRYWAYSDDNLVSIWLALSEENSMKAKFRISGPPIVFSKSRFLRFCFEKKTSFSKMLPFLSKFLLP